MVGQHQDPSIRKVRRWHPQKDAAMARICMIIAMRHLLHHPRDIQFAAPITPSLDIPGSRWERQVASRMLHDFFVTIITHKSV